jgi:hypothetical protein
MKNFSFLKNIFFALAILAAVVACDNDYDLLGSDVVDGDIHNTLNAYNGQVTAYDRKIGAVQTNSLTTNLLGSYKSVFGRTTASYVTQVQLASTAPSFTENITIDSVWVYVPYASTQTGSETNTTTKETDNLYKINSQYGKSTDKFRLRITENNYFIRGTEAASGSVNTQNYYSDEAAMFAANQGQQLLDTEMSFSNLEIKRRASYKNDADSTKTVIAERLAPGIFYYLDTAFFKNKVLDPSKAAQLSTNAAFADYFRGLSFWAEPIGDNSTMLSPNFASGYIKVIYNQDVFSNGAPVFEKDANGNDTTTRKRSHLTMTINLKGNHVNFFTTEDNTDYLTGVTTSDATNGDDRIYLRGGAGSMAVLNIFSQTQIDDLKKVNALINEAHIRFKVDFKQNDGITAIPYDSIPSRIYLYDLTNKRPLYDYSTDGTTASNTKGNKYVYNGIYNKNDSTYTIHLTNHITNIVRHDSTNVKLGLVLTDDITVNTNQPIKTPFTEDATAVKVIPTANVITPLGVKLYGSSPAVEEKKRLKFEIFYTNPKP